MIDGNFVIRTRSRNPLVYSDFSKPMIPSPIELKLKSASAIIDKNYLGVALNSQAGYAVNANIQPVILVSQD